MIICMLLPAPANYLQTPGTAVNNTAENVHYNQAFTLDDLWDFQGWI
jgi:hypothetical protein